ncbi:MAG: prevent-host-death protein [Gammaproteobacteria bacterium]|nr:prevent-host-death protein [Gammaproteobacteria bacterium]
MNHSKPYPVWTVAQAKARLSEILRLAEKEGPQRIGARKAFIVVPERTWRAQISHHKSLGQWLVDNMPRGAELEAPNRHEPVRAISFAAQDDE